MKDYWKGFRSWPLSWQIGTAVGGVYFLYLFVNGAIDRWDERMYWYTVFSNLVG